MRIFAAVRRIATHSRGSALHTSRKSHRGPHFGNVGGESMSQGSMGSTMGGSGRRSMGSDSLGGSGTFRTHAQRNALRRAKIGGMVALVDSRDLFLACLGDDDDGT